MNSLIEKVAKVMAAQVSLAPFDKLSTNTKAAYCQKAAPIITIVLDHFSDPVNVTPAMVNALDDAWLGMVDSEPRSVCIHAAIAAAMKAAKEEISSNIKPKSTHPG